ncbi:hypothetical protein ERD95_06120 [Enterobacteriaceae bacterium ML5]|nr:hypothetical protein ERD95_06120 [Enterobacteriaceae bacterium ML5]
MLIELTPQEKETLRVALLNFNDELREDGMGGDEHGRLMVTLYLTHSESILQKLASVDGFRTPPTKE